MDWMIPGVERMEGKSTANISKSFSDATKLLRSQGRSGKVWVLWNSLREGGSQRQHLGRGWWGGCWSRGAFQGSWWQTCPPPPSSVVGGAAAGGAPGVRLGRTSCHVDVLGKVTSSWGWGQSSDGTGRECEYLGEGSQQWRGAAGRPPGRHCGRTLEEQ